MSAVADGEAGASFPIVAVGASAGGLAPTEELLRAVGTQPGVALVVIHHLDPTHESGLVEILSRATPMPVAQATDGVRVQPNHVYVIPPNAGLLISQGTLHVGPRLDEGGLHLPIDRFFESLAQDRQALAVGVVLSGSGFDGTEGIKAIKREGGITLVQDASASFASMPESAVATGCVDFILPTTGLGRELARIGAHAPSLTAVPPRGFEEPEYIEILAAMQRFSGVDFASYKHSTLRRRIQRRLFLRGLTDLPAYRDLLKREASEIAALCEEVLIHVTSFFREPAAFEALRARVFPTVCESRPDDLPVRIWIPGCSTGEEVYSIAICLLEFLGEAHRDLPIKIFGTDLSLASIEKARAGRYLESIARDISPDRLQRFFTKDQEGYQIRSEIRDLCVFAKHDLTHDPPFSAMDVISCRNVMIYLGPELQDRVIALLHYALNEPGFLMLGTSETVRAFTGFTAIDGKNKIYARAPAATRLTFDFATPHFMRTSTRQTPSGTTSSDAFGGGKQLSLVELDREADRLVLAEFAPPGVIVTNDLSIVQFRGQTGPFLEPAPGVASLDVLRMAREELRLPLRRAIDQARAGHGPARETGLTLVTADKRRTIALEVIPFGAQSAEPFFLVLFQDMTAHEEGATGEPRVDVSQAETARESALQSEIVSTRRYLESVIEQFEATTEELKAANEEIVSSNEELRSTNEELQSAKEELQATNDELRTINEELNERNVDATRLSDDLANVLSSADIPILIIGRNMHLRRFTPAAGKVFGLLAPDVGRPISDVKHVLTVAPALVRMLPDVLERLVPSECKIQDASGHWYLLSVRPYVTLDGRIDGTVTSARDVDAEMKAAETLAAERKYADDIVDTVREGLIVLDRDLRAQTANKAFHRAFPLAPEKIGGRSLDELGQPELGSRALRQLLEELREGTTAEGFRIEREGGAEGPHAYLLNARHIEGAGLILLAFEDVTEAERARAEAQRADLRFRDVLTQAKEAILMVDPGGKVVLANRAAAKLFGYETEELVGLSVELLMPERFREMHPKLRTDYLTTPSPRPMGSDRILVGRRKDGTEVPIEVVLSTMTRENGPVVIAFVTDITLRAQQDRLQRIVFDAALTEERERRRMAIELHDRIGQGVALAEIKLTSVRKNLAGEPRSAVDGVIEILDQTIVDMRTLVFQLSPPILYDLGLKQAVTSLAADLEKRHGFKVDVTDDGAAKPLDDAAKAIAFRTVRELLMNVLKHAGAPARVSLRRAGDDLAIDVEDSGVGFDPRAATDGGNVDGFGLVSVREQLSSLGGTLRIESTPGTGARVSVTMPLQAGPEPGSDRPASGTGTT